MRGRLLLLLLGIAVGVLAGEAASRMGERVGCRDYTDWFWERNPFYGWGHKPDARGWAQRCLGGKPEWRTYTSINSHGLRDREIPYERQGAFRILVLGDSFTEGQQVDQDHTFVKLLERQLNAEAGGPPAFEVINGGVSAWGTDNELLFFRNEGWKYHPDLVLLAFNTGNDVLENDQPLMRATDFPYLDKPYFELNGSHLVLRRFPLPRERLLGRVRDFVRNALARHSALYRLAAALRLPRVARPADAAPAPPGPTRPIEVYLRDYPEPWREAWRITRGLVLRLRREVEARGGRFAAVVINGREEVSPGRLQWQLALHPELQAYTLDVDKPNRLITQFLARRGIPAVALLDDFRARFGKAGTPGFYEWDIHWAPAGHELAAQVIGRRLRELGLVPVAARPSRE